MSWPLCFCARCIFYKTSVFIVNFDIYSVERKKISLKTGNPVYYPTSQWQVLLIKWKRNLCILYNDIEGLQFWWPKWLHRSYNFETKLFKTSKHGKKRRLPFFTRSQMCERSVTYTLELDNHKMLFVYIQVNGVESTLHIVFEFFFHNFCSELGSESHFTSVVFYLLRAA